MLSLSANSGFKDKLVNLWLAKNGTVISACSPMVADVAMIIELAGNSLPPFTALFDICCNELSKIRPFSLISSILNQGIEPFSQYSLFDLEGV
nr:hypothetical protein [Neisseria meningitidis]